MAKNIIIKTKNALDIDRKVERVLKDLGNPEPPLDLEVVRDLLKLDLAYYTAKDPGVLQEVISKMTMAGKQVLARPSRILDAVRKFDLRALYIPDRKKILLDKDQPKFLIERRSFLIRINQSSNTVGMKPTKSVTVSCLGTTAR